MQQFKRGDFVLLKKITISKARNLHKAKPIYHKTIYRIIRRTKTNAYLLPYTKKFMQNRLKFESKIPRNMVTLQRLSNLKKIHNILPLLNLSLTQQMVLELDRIIQMETQDVKEVKYIKNEVKDKNLPIITDFSPTVYVDEPAPPHSARVSYGQIANIELQTLSPETVTEFQDDTLSFITQTRIIQHKKKLPSDWGSSTKIDKLSSFIMDNSFYSIDNQIPAADNQSHFSEDGMTGTSDDSDDGEIREIESIRITPGPSKSTTTRTIIRLPSGKALSITNTPIPQHEIRDKQPSTTVKYSKRPRSLIKDFITSKK